MSGNINYNWKDKLFLIVEDDPASSMLLEIILSKTGAKLLFAESGEMSIEIVKMTRGIDIILMDIKMKGISGFQATTFIKQIAPDIPIIAQTACVVYGDKERCFDSGCSGYIPKPINYEVLLETINDHLKKVTPREVTKDQLYSN
jgi:CheY-like chemotaxis protein